VIVTAPVSTRLREVFDRSRRTLAVLLLAAVPWTVVVYPGGFDFLFAWGLFNTNPPHVLTLVRFLTVETPGPMSLPDRLLAWPVATVFYLAGLVSVASSVLDREDRRVTAAALALAALTHARVSAGFFRIGESVLPVGAVVLLGAACWALGGQRDDRDFEDGPTGSRR
jgi:uncharacterized protein (TIGR04206 family)